MSLVTCAPLLLHLGAVMAANLGGLDDTGGATTTKDTTTKDATTATQTASETALTVSATTGTDTASTATGTTGTATTGTTGTALGVTYNQWGFTGSQLVWEATSGGSSGSTASGLSTGTSKSSTNSALTVLRTSSSQRVRAMGTAHGWKANAAICGVVALTVALHCL